MLFQFPLQHPPTLPLSFSLFKGSLGDISKFSSFSDLNEVNSYLSLNVSSALALTAGMLEVFPSRPGRRWSVVNISSLFAAQPLPNWVLYCTAKAARKMMFSVLADEEPNVKVLSYSPGTCAFILTTKKMSFFGTGLRIPPFKASVNGGRKAQRGHPILSDALISPVPSGPMDTDMQKDIQRLTGIKHHLIPCKEPAAKLMQLLLDNEFASGSHLDFFTA